MNTYSNSQLIIRKIFLCSLIIVLVQLNTFGYNIQSLKDAYSLYNLINNLFKDKIELVDADNDGFDSDVDCDDSDPTIYPGATEIPGDDIDQNCDGFVACYTDVDSDGFGSSSSGESTFAATGGIANTTGACGSSSFDNWDNDSGDCDDSDASVYPGAPEIVGNGVDEDCDTKEICYTDADNDGIRTNSTISSTDRDCSDSGEAYAADMSGDCDDTNASIYPGAVEIVGNGIDEDCDGGDLCYLDADNDGYRPDGISTVASIDLDCNDSGEATPGEPIGDCDDADATVYPNAVEIVGNGIDDDCDGYELCYCDADNDGYRPDGTATVLSIDLDCNDSGEATPGEPIGDCNDNDATIYPGATEIVGNGIDENCDGQEVCYMDSDNDGYRPDGTSTVTSLDIDCNDFGEASSSEPVGDCNDFDASIYPGAVEIVGNGIDENCDGQEICYVDADDDGYRPDRTSTVTSLDLDCNDSGEASSSEPYEDCDDTNANINPGVTEIIGNGIDEDCDGYELCYCDADNDGYRPDGTATVLSLDLDCNDSGEAIPSDPIGDCNDTDPTIYPGATEIIGNGIDEDCDGQEVCYEDADNDGYRTNATVASIDIDCYDQGEANATDPDGDCNDMDDTINPAATEVCGDNIDNDCSGQQHPMEVDIDGDGLYCDDPCPNDPENDADGDLHCEEVDNCDMIYNPVQSDTDNDGIGDSCDPDFVEIENTGIGTSVPKTGLHLVGKKLYLDKNTGSIIMKSPNGECWLLSISNTGTISSVKIDCPV